MCLKFFGSSKQSTSRDERMRLRYMVWQKSSDSTIPVILGVMMIFLDRGQAMRHPCIVNVVPVCLAVDASEMSRCEREP